MLRTAPLLVFFLLPGATACSLMAQDGDAAELRVFEGAGGPEASYPTPVAAGCLDPWTVAVDGSTAVWLAGGVVHVVPLGGGAQRVLQLPPGAWEDITVAGNDAWVIAGSKVGRLNLVDGAFRWLDVVVGLDPARRFLHEGTLWAERQLTDPHDVVSRRYWSRDLVADSTLLPGLSKSDIGLANGNATLVSANRHAMVFDNVPKDGNYPAGRWSYDIPLRRLDHLNLTWQDPLLDGDRFLGRVGVAWFAVALPPQNPVAVAGSTFAPMEVEGDRFVRLVLVEAAPPTSAAPTPGPSTTTAQASAEPPTTTEKPRVVPSNPALALAVAFGAAALVSRRRRVG